MSEKNKPITNPKVKEAIALVKKTPTKESQLALFETIKSAKFLAPAVFDFAFPPKQGGKIVMPKDAKIKFILINTKDGRSFFPAFTDIEEAKKLTLPQKGNVQQIVRTINDYGKMVTAPVNKTEGVVINPMTDNIILNLKLIKILSGLEKEGAPSLNPGVAANSVYAEPSVYPTQMVNAVHDACKDIPEVSRVWLKALMQGPMMTFVLIVEAKSFNDALATKIKDIAVPHSKDIPVEVIAYSEEIEKKAVKGAFPLYDDQLDV